MWTDRKEIDEEYELNETINGPLVEVDKKYKELSDNELEEIRMRLMVELFSVEAECNRRGLD